MHHEVYVDGTNQSIERSNERVKSKIDDFNFDRWSHSIEIIIEKFFLTNGLQDK